MSEACATIVARDDPHLHATALFAPQPGRSRLMVLYAFDVELSRAAHASTESLIPRMRLQWWRDVAEAARAGGAAPAHEVAGPLTRLLAETAPPAGLADALIEAREMELEGGFDAPRFAAWAQARFGALTALAVHILTDGDPESVALARRAGPVLGAAFALRHALRMAAEGRSFVPGLAPGDRAGLAEGEMTDGAREALRALANSAQADLASLRAQRGRADRRATPALLPLARAGRVLDRAARLTRPRAGESARRPAAGAGSAPGSALPLADLGHADRPFEGLGLALRAASGRW